MKRAFDLSLMFVALAVSLIVLAPSALAQTGAADIELTEVDPTDGSEFAQPPEVVHLCFSEPVEIDDNTMFRFAYITAEDRQLGLRIVFQPDGECVDVYPGLQDEQPAGEYTFEWEVRAAEGEAEGSGTLKFDVTEGRPATPRGTPSTPQPTPAATPTPADAGDDDDGPDILLVALITVGGIAGAALLFTLGYLARKRIGFEPHRPPEDGDGSSEH